MITRLRTKILACVGMALLACPAFVPGPVEASSHMDAPLITLDPAANTTDVYAFLRTRPSDNAKVLVVALAVYPFEEPGIGPNKYNFDDNVLYEIHVATGSDVAAGNATISYQFRFETMFKNSNTILQSYTGVVENVDDPDQNLVQRYTVSKVVRQGGGVTGNMLGGGIVPPNNQGIATPFYNLDDNGENPARPGVASLAELDRYTMQSIVSLAPSTATYRVFAGQREDGFYGDIQAIFDLLQLRSGKTSFDSQAGFNVHEIVLEIPISEFGGDDQQQVGVYATTSRQSTRVLSENPGSPAQTLTGEFVQVGRQGNPLFNEGLVAIADKDLYSRTKPSSDAALFDKYARSPELAKLINAIVFGQTVAPEENRTDLVGIFIPDLIRVDLSTGPARLAGGGPNFAANPDEQGFSRMSIFGGDTLTSTITEGFGDGAVPGGWPNGRRYGDDVVDIAVTAIISDLRTSPPTIRSADGIDNVSRNDRAYSKVFPYASTPLNGRNHEHHNITATGGGPARFQNISTRGVVQTDDGVLIGGVIIGGSSNQTVVIRAIGPSLSGSNVPDPLADPVLEVYSGSTLIAMNDNWMQSNDSMRIQDAGLAPTDGAEAAVFLELAPGAYTFIVRGKDMTTGIGLVEAYAVE